MPAFQSQFDNQPLRYYRGHPIYLTAYLAVGMAVGIVLVLLLSSARVNIMPLAFIPGLFTHGMLWQPLTYVFVNELSFFTPFGLLCFYSWGMEVEKYLGRRRFLAICAALIAAPALFQTACYFVGFGGSPLLSNFFLISGLLVAFATLYPSIEYFGWVPLKWVAFVCIACGSLTYFPSRDWLGLATLWLDCAVAFGMVRGTQGLLSIRLPKFRWPASRPKLRIVPKAERPATARFSAPIVSEAGQDVDALLDKIARSGLESLSPAERARLERARQELLKKGR
jgi:hypothetical protein